MAVQGMPIDGPPITLKEIATLVGVDADEFAGFAVFLLRKDGFPLLTSNTQDPAHLMFLAGHLVCALSQSMIGLTEIHAERDSIGPPGDQG